ncbi:MAG: DUF6789 family protein [bacterium]
MNWPAAITAGIWGTVVMTLTMYYVPPVIGLPPMDIGTMLGTMFLPHDEATALGVGLGLHFVNGIIFVLAYAGVLLALRVQSTAWRGAVLGVILWLAGAMLLLDPIMEMHPLVQSGEMTNPGYFMLNMGMGWKPAMFSLVTHLVYGLIAGFLYRHHART